MRGFGAKHTEARPAEMHTCARDHDGTIHAVVLEKPIGPQMLLHQLHDLIHALSMTLDECS